MMIETRVEVHRSALYFLAHFHKSVSRKPVWKFTDLNTDKAMSQAEETREAIRADGGDVPSCETGTPFVSAPIIACIPGDGPRSLLTCQACPEIVGTDETL